MNRSCKSCGDTWKVDPFEADWCRSRNTALPRSCPSCRADKRKLVGKEITCSKCSTVFPWPKELALYAAMYGWKEPPRCPGGCEHDLDQVRRFRGDMYAIGPVWLRVVEGVDLDADPAGEPEEDERERKVPKLEDLFKNLGSGLSSPGYGDLPARPPKPEPEPTVDPKDDLPPEKLPSPESLFSFKKK